MNYHVQYKHSILGFSRFIQKILIRPGIFSMYKLSFVHFVVP